MIPIFTCVSRKTPMGFQVIILGTHLKTYFIANIIPFDPDTSTHQLSNGFPNLKFTLDFFFSLRLPFRLDFHNVRLFVSSSVPISPPAVLLLPGKIQIELSDTEGCVRIT